MEQLLGLPESTIKVLAALNAAELAAMVETLQRKLSERSAVMGQKNSENAVDQFYNFFGLNLLALYVPASLPIILSLGFHPIAIPMSPVFFVAFTSNSHDKSFGLLLIYLVLVGVASTSALLFRHRWAWWVMPIGLGAYSFVQAIIGIAMVQWYA